MKPEALAIVRIPALDQVRPAALVFADDQGVTWVEPGYADPDPPARNPVHRIEGTVVERGAGLAIEGDGRELATVVPMGTPGADDPEGSCSAALLAYTDTLAARGLSLEGERAAVAEELAR